MPDPPLPDPFPPPPWDFITGRILFIFYLFAVFQLPGKSWGDEWRC